MEEEGVLGCAAAREGRHGPPSSTSVVAGKDAGNLLHRHQVRQQPCNLPLSPQLAGLVTMARNAHAISTTVHFKCHDWDASLLVLKYSLLNLLQLLASS